MPELPEVEAARRLLERGCVGKIIEKAVVADDDKVFDGASADKVRQALEGRRVVAIHRKGKYLWLELDNPEGPWPLLHFGMTGGIVVQKMGASKYKRIHLESDPDTWPPRFSKMEVDLEGGAKVALVDSRRFARVKLQVDPPTQEPVSKLGFDVLEELPSVAEFTAAVRKRVARAQGLKIKALLLDQEFCSGIGNWVGDEVLYHARIHPEQTAASLDDKALAALHDAIKYVVGLAVEEEADSDQFPRDWLFHYRWTNKKPSSVNGHKIEFVSVGSRTSAFVPALQKLTVNGEGSNGASKKTAKGKPRGSSGSKRGRSKKVESSEETEDEEEEEEEEDDKAVAKKAGVAMKAAASGRSKRAVGKPKGASKAVGKGGGDETEEDVGDSSEEEGDGDNEADQDEDYSDEEAALKKKQKKARPRTAKAAKPAAKKPTAAKGNPNRSARSRDGRKT